MASPTDDSRKTIADSIMKITNSISSLNIVGLHQLKRLGNKVIYSELTPLLSTPFDWSEGNSTVCRMNSSDYLSLNGEKSINDATIAVINEFGTGRNGNFSQGGETYLHIELENVLKTTYGSEAAMITPNGTLSNFNVMNSLATMGYADVFFSDEHNHATLISGMQLAQVANKMVNIHKYNHLDYKTLKSQLEKYRSEFPNNKIVIVSDGVFSMQGTIADVDILLQLANKYDTLLVLDECHSLGVLGHHGLGTLEHCHVDWTPRIIITGTFGKSIPCNGGYVACSQSILSRVLRYGRFSMFCGTMTPVDCATAISSLNFLYDAVERRIKLHSLVKLWRKLIYGIYTASYKSTDDKYARFYRENLTNPSPIVPFYFNLGPGDHHERLHKLCVSMIVTHRLLVIPIVYPAVPQGEELFRTLVTTETNEEELYYWSKCLEREYRNILSIPRSSI